MNNLKMYFLDIYKFFVCAVLGRRGTISTQRALGQTCPSFYYLGMTLSSSKLFRVVLVLKKLAQTMMSPCRACLACFPARCRLLRYSTSTQWSELRRHSPLHRFCRGCIIYIEQV